MSILEGTATSWLARRGGQKSRRASGLGPNHLQPAGTARGACLSHLEKGRSAGGSTGPWHSPSCPQAPRDGDSPAATIPYPSPRRTVVGAQPPRPGKTSPAGADGTGEFIKGVRSGGSAKPCCPPPPRGWRRGVGSGAAGARPARRGDPWHGFRARRRRASCASVCSPGTARADVLKTPGTQ